MSELASAVVSITRTVRGRFFWAAWWTHAPIYWPFQKPDAAGGGASTRDEAFAAATAAAGQRHLSRIESYWAHAVNRLLRGDRLPPQPSPRPRGGSSGHGRGARPRSAAEILGVSKGANLLALKKAHRERALATHPDRGGDADAFREAQQAYERLLAKLPARRLEGPSE